MQTSTVVFACNVALVLVAVAGLCLTSSVFDFIVLSKKYYTVPDHTVLIDPRMQFWIYPSFAFSFLLSFLPLLSVSAGSKIIKFTVNHFMVLSIIHCLLLLGATVLSSLVSLYCAQNAHAIEIFAETGSPTEFQHASLWYYSRLRAIMVMSIIQCALNGIVVARLYFGVSCEPQHAFSKIPEKPAQPDIVERTTYFA